MTANAKYNGSTQAFPTMDCPGMKLREYIATQALQGLIACPAGSGVFNEVAEDAVKYADALLEALEKSKP